MIKWIESNPWKSYNFVDNGMSNPGLVAIWDEEKTRHRERQGVSMCSPPPSQMRPVYFDTETNQRYIEYLKQKISSGQVRHS